MALANAVFAEFVTIVPSSSNGIRNSNNNSIISDNAAKNYRFCTDDDIADIKCYLHHQDVNS